MEYYISSKLFLQIVISKHGIYSVKMSFVDETHEFISQIHPVFVDVIFKWKKYQKIQSNGEFALAKVIDLQTRTHTT